MRRTTLKTLKQSLLGLVWLAVAARLLIPIGYMPAPIGDGGLIFCPGGIVSAAPHSHQHTGHAHNIHHQSGADDGGRDHRSDEQGRGLSWDHCPYGALAKSAPVSFALTPAIISARPSAIAPLSMRVYVHTPTSAFRARAPPASLA